MQQIALFGREQEDEAHHHRQSCLIEFFFSDACQQRGLILFDPPIFLVELIEGVYQRLDSMPDLISELIGDFLLLEGTPGE